MSSLRSILSGGKRSSHRRGLGLILICLSIFCSAATRLTPTRWPRKQT